MNESNSTKQKLEFTNIQKSNKTCSDLRMWGLDVNLLAPELFFLILAHSVHKMWIIQEPNKLELWNKLHFKEKKKESVHHV